MVSLPGTIAQINRLSGVITIPLLLNLIENNLLQGVVLSAPVAPASERIS
jgi:hypothetical protein